MENTPNPDFEVTFYDGNCTIDKKIKAFLQIILKANLIL
jgi:hypothetical protein